MGALRRGGRAELLVDVLRPSSAFYSVPLTCVRTAPLAALPLLHTVSSPPAPALPPRRPQSPFDSKCCVSTRHLL